jgi:protein gp37
MRIFVNSMTDLFWEQISIEDIKRVFAVMNECHDRQIGHTFQILTKRSKRLVELAHNLNWTPNIWIGVSVENQRWTSRITDLVAVPAAIRFISAEPLLGPIDLTQWIDKIHWVIVGGESGPKFRPMRQDWARSLRTQCEERGVAFFYKQDAAGRTETRPYLVEVDGSHTRYHQLPR